MQLSNHQSFHKQQKRPSFHGKMRKQHNSNQDLSFGGVCLQGEADFTGRCVGVHLCKSDV